MLFLTVSFSLSLSFLPLQFELAVDMVTLIDPKTVVGGQNLNGLLASLKARNQVNNTMIFKFSDIVTLSVLNVDLDYAAKGKLVTSQTLSNL